MRHFLALSVLFFLFVGPAGAQRLPQVKKLIEYGWDVPDAAFVRQHIREMEKLPFDGLIFHLAGWPESGQVFTGKKWNDAKFAQALEDCKSIGWEKFTDNFLVMLAASDMDWFSDSDWEAVRHNVGLVARAGALARCRGICFDPEPYGKSPWQYSIQAHAGQKSFEEYQAKARQRGGEFMKAILEQMPHPVIHTFFLLSLFGDLVDEPDLAKRERLLSKHGYGLLPAFLNGMLDAATPDVVITDGNEPSYYYTSPLPFYQSYLMVHQRALSMIAPENIRKYQSQVQMSQALYVDYLFALGRWGKEDNTPAAPLSPEERQRWFEHNTYYSLTTSDEFVWLYSENMNWWTNTTIPQGLEAAVRSARAKAANHQPLGFEIEGVIKTGEERRKAELQARLQRRTAEITRRDPGAGPPAIDGKLEDAAWQKAANLGPFLPYVTVAGNPAALTEARVTYDSNNLYIGVRCAEPERDQMKIVGEKRDEDVWMGDSLDLFLSQGEAPTPYVHLILNPKSVHWDALVTDHEDLEFNPEWKSAVSMDNAGWTVEAAIPWKEIRMNPPAPGEKHRANLCRQRIPGEEHTSWSQVVSGFVEPESLGIWEFR